MFRIHTSRIAAISLLLSTAALPQTGLAQSYLVDAQKGARTVYTTSLSDVTQGQSTNTTRTLDWRQPTTNLYFDLPPSERTSTIVLTLSADPLTRVARNAPLQVQFNNEKPVPILSSGRGFQARISLDANRARDRRNVLRISYPAPNGTECVAPEHGAWSIDLTESTLRMSGRVQRRNMSLSEVTEYLAQPGLSPKTVGLIARGPDGVDMQALAAQGIALRTPGVPKFSVSSRGTDFNVVMVKRSRLFDITNDPMILNSSGPRIFVPRGRPTELVFTAETDAEIITMLELFATRRLPTTRRPISSLGELNLQNRLDNDAFKVDRKTSLLDLAVASEDSSTGAQTYKFGVSDPTAMGGEVLLRLSANEDLAETSRLQVTLNGRTLGAAKLDKKRKSVAFDIQPGALNATSNVLTLTPDLKPTSEFSCQNSYNGHPGFTISDRSRLNLTKVAPSPVTELSQLTSSGGLFAQSESYIVLPRQTRNYQAALRVLGRLAKSTGHGLTMADYTRSADVASDKHVLLIGPANMVKGHLTGAPKAFREALSGRSSTGDNLLQASYEQSASLGANDAALKYAAKQSAPRRILRGGVAALYSAGNGSLTGVISSTPGSSFSQTSQKLIEAPHWNAMRGGVARWTNASMVTAQTAQSDVGIRQPKPETGFEFPDLGLAALDAFDDLDLRWQEIDWPEVDWPEVDWPEVDWPEVDWPEVNWPEFDIPQVSLPNVPWPSFKSTKADVMATSADLTRGASAPKAKTDELRKAVDPQKAVKVADVMPRLKPTFKRPANASVGLRGPIEFSNTAPSRFGSFQDVRRVTKEKWSATKRWLKTKTASLSDVKTFDDVARAADRLKDQVKPAGRSTSASLKDKLPGKGLVQIGERTFSAYGLLLMLAFGLVLLLMSLASPASRLGGRH